jgi:hypothetical protein
MDPFTTRPLSTGPSRPPGRWVCGSAVREGLRDELRQLEAAVAADREDALSFADDSKAGKRAAARLAERWRRHKGPEAELSKDSGVPLEFPTLAAIEREAHRVVHDRDYELAIYHIHRAYDVSPSHYAARVRSRLSTKR